MDSRSRALWAIGAGIVAAMIIALFTQARPAASSGNPWSPVKRLQRLDLYVIEVKKGSYVLNSEATLPYMPILPPETAGTSRTKASVVLKTMCKFSAVPDSEKDKKSGSGVELAAGSRLPFSFSVSKSGKIDYEILTGVPGTQFTVPSGTTVGTQKVVKGKLVSTFNADAEGFVTHTFEGTEIGTRVINLHTNRVFEYQSSNVFVKVK